MPKMTLMAAAAFALVAGNAHAHDPNWLSPLLPWHPPYWESELALQQSFEGDTRDLDDKVITVLEAYACCWADFLLSDPGNPGNQLYNRINSPQEEELHGEDLEAVALRDDEFRQDLLRQEAANPLSRSFMYLAMYCHSSGLFDSLETNVRETLLNVHVTKLMSKAIGVPAYDPALVAFIDAHLDRLALHFAQQFFLQAAWNAIPVVHEEPKKRICVLGPEKELLILPGLIIKQDDQKGEGTVTYVSEADVTVEWEKSPDAPSSWPNTSVVHYTEATLRHYIHSGTFSEIGQKELSDKISNLQSEIAGKNQEIDNLRSLNTSLSQSEQGYMIGYPAKWAVHRIDGTIYLPLYGGVAKVTNTGSGKFDIAFGNNPVSGHIVREDDHYDIFSTAGDRIGRLWPCRWDGNGNGWSIYTTIQGYIGHIDEQGNWYLIEGCSLQIDLFTLHDWYLKHTKKFKLPESQDDGAIALNSATRNLPRGSDPVLGTTKSRSRCL